jgi:hypothetical protein
MALLTPSSGSYPGTERQFRTSAALCAAARRPRPAGGTALQLAGLLRGRLSCSPISRFPPGSAINIYEDSGAFALPTGRSRPPSALSVAPRGPGGLDDAQLSRFEEVLGTRGRSSYQLEGWEAVRPDPEQTVTERSGTSSPERSTAVAHTGEHGFDLREYAQRNWSALGPKLAGKLHFFAGDMDHFYLNLAVYQFEDFHKSTTNPRSDAEFTYGRPTKGHSGHAFPWAELVRRMAAHVRRTAPPGKNTAAWS